MVHDNRSQFTCDHPHRHATSRRLDRGKAGGVPESARFVRLRARGMCGGRNVARLGLPSPCPAIGDRLSQGLGCGARLRHASARGGGAVACAPRCRASGLLQGRAGGRMAPSRRAPDHVSAPLSPCAPLLRATGWPPSTAPSGYDDEPDEDEAMGRLDWMLEELTDYGDPPRLTGEVLAPAAASSRAIDGGNFGFEEASTPGDQASA